MPAVWNLWRRREPKGISPSVREAALRYRSILADYLAGDLAEDYFVQYRRYHDMWSHESTHMPEHLFRALDKSHGDLHDFDPVQDDPNDLRQKLSAVIAEIDAALRE